MASSVSFFRIRNEYGSRIGFHHAAVNPQDAMGKAGVYYHSRLGNLFHRTIRLQGTEGKAQRPETLYLNRKNFIEWLNPQLPNSQKISPKDSEKKIVDLFQQQITHNKQVGQHAHTQKLLTHQGIPTARKLDSLFNFMRSTVVKKFWDFTLSSYTRFRLRFLVIKCEKHIKRFSELRAMAAFWDAYNTTPAYKKFIDAKCSNKFPKEFKEIPPIDKKNYITAYPFKDTLRFSSFPDNGQIDTSTGTTGKPTKWVRGPYERDTVRTLIHYAAQVVMGKQPFIFINAFALGPWATGMTTAGAITDMALTLSTGPDIEKILDAIQEFADAKRPYIIAGYPPFIKKLTETAKEKNIDLSKYNLIGIVGGEGMSENLRQRIIDGGFQKVFSSYGASDLDINIGYESDFEVQLRKACEKNPELAKELYGANQNVPMIFHYDPLNYLIEADSQNNLVYTCVRQDRASPRIRYQLGDEGRVMAISDVLAIMQKYGIQLVDSNGKELKPNTNLPLVFIWGRQGTAVSFNGAKVAPENLEQALEKQPALATENYGFSSYEDKNCNKQIQILVEVGKGIDPKSFDNITLRDQILEGLCKANQDFKWQVEKAKQENLSLPELVLFAHNTGPMTNQDPHRKKQYIYSGKK